MLGAVGLVIVVLALLALRQNIIVILLCFAAYIHLVWGQGQISYLVEDIWISLDNEVLLAIPMFIIAGAVMTRGSIAERLIAIIRAFTEWLPGGLGLAAIVSCAVFAAISGSSPVTLLAVGSVLYPILLEAGYGKRFALGSLTSAGTLGIIIPPSIPLILYGIVTETNIADLFMAGVGPGLLLTAALGGYGLWVNRHLTPVRFQATAAVAAVKRGIWAMLLPVILLGGIYSGYFSPTEAAAVALGYALVVEFFIHRELGLGDLHGIVISTVRLLGTLLPILAVALSIKSLLAIEGIPQAFAAWVSASVGSKVAFLIAVNLTLFAVGCLIDVISAILLLGPIFFAAAESYGINPVHFGIIMVLNLEIGFLTPPVGLNLIVAMTAFREKFLEICIAVIPFVAIMFAVLMLITFVPEIPLAFVP